MADPQISGGTHSSELVAAFADMRIHSAQLQQISAFMFDKGGRTVQLAFDGDLLESTILTPRTAADAQTNILFAAGLVTAQGVQVTILQVFLDGAVQSYEAADAAISRTVDALAFGAGFAVGAVIVVGVTSAAAAAAGAAAVYAVGVAGAYQVGEFADSAGQALNAGLDVVVENPWLLGTVLIPGTRGVLPGLVAAAAAGAFARAYSPTDAAAAATQKLIGDLDTLIALLPSQDELGAWPNDELLPWLQDHPDLAEILVRLAPGILAGATFTASLELGINPAFTFGALSVASGGPWPPLDIDQAIDRVIGLGSHFGAFSDDTGGLTIAEREFLEEGEPPLPPVDLKSLFEGASQIDINGNNRDTLLPDAFADIRIVQQPGPDGTDSWIVQIPSTQSWSPIAGSTPNDLTSDLWAVGQRESALMEAVKEAMEMAGIGGKDPVMFAGFSLGGITAAYLGSDPWVNAQYNVTHVVTAGAPIGLFDFPPDVQVTSFEHTDDLVVSGDGRSNPATPNQVTIRNDNPGTNGPLRAHDALNYSESADRYQASDDPNAARFRESTKNFFDGTDAVVTDYAAERVTGR